jgi:hypothetical protein
MHVYEIHTREMHAHETHAYEMHARKMHARGVHAREMPQKGFGETLPPYKRGVVVDLSRSELQNRAPHTAAGRGSTYNLNSQASGRHSN